MSESRGIYTSAILVSAFAMSISDPAAAQNAGREHPAAAEMSEIIVTAEKISENLQHVPLAVTAIGEKQLAQFHATQLTDIGGYVPGMQIDSTGTPGQTTVAIRGIGGLDNNATASMYIDETPIGANAPDQRGGVYMLDILPYDVQRIEVLAGPQGTLYGANAFGGVVKYVLTKPNLDHADVRVGVDGFSISHAKDAGIGVHAMVNTPIIQDKLGVLFSYSKLDTPGFIDNANTGQKDQNTVKQQSARFSILGQPSDDLTIRLGILYSDIKADGNASIPLDNTDNPKPLYAGYTDNNFAPNIYDDRMYYYSLDLNWDLHWAKLVSATSYTNDHSVTDIDATQTYFGLADLIYNTVTGADLDPARTIVKFPLDITNKKFTQELRLNSNVGKLDWMLGGYYDDERGSNLQNLPVTTLDGAAVPIVDPLFDGSFPVTYREIAAFGNVDYHFTDRFDVALGLRYAHNRQTFRHTITPVTYNIIDPGDVLGRSSEGVTTYNFAPRYQVDPNNMVYARVATGYQAGGPNIAVFGAVPQIEASRITTYETGWKASFPAAHAELNLAIYDNEWSKIQVGATAPGGVGITLNAGKARSSGFTLDGNIRPLAGLTLSANFAYTDARLIDDSAHAAGGPGGFRGDNLPHTPKVAGALKADYAWPLNTEWTARMGGGVHATGSRWMSGTELASETIGGITLNPGDNRLDKYRLGGYTAADLNADLSNGRYTFGLYVKNVTDKKAFLTAQDVPDGLTNAPIEREAVVLRPRTIGVSIDVKFQ